MKKLPQVTKYVRTKLELWRNSLKRKILVVLILFSLKNIVGAVDAIESKRHIVFCEF